MAAKIIQKIYINEGFSFPSVAANFKCAGYFWPDRFSWL